MTAITTIHLLYRRAVDHRIARIMDRAGFVVAPVSVASSLPRQGGIVAIDVGADLEGGGAVIEQVVARMAQRIAIVICTGGSIEFFRRCFKTGMTDVIDRSFDDFRIAEAFEAVRAAAGSSAELGRQRQVRVTLLTQREREVLRHVVQGRTAREIGQLLTLSCRTIELYRARIRAKLQVRNTVQLVSEYNGVVVE
jgi:two-component system response regulator FixJ